VDGLVVDGLRSMIVVMIVEEKRSTKEAMMRREDKLKTRASAHTHTHTHTVHCTSDCHAPCLFVSVGVLLCVRVGVSSARACPFPPFYLPFPLHPSPPP